MSKIYSIQDKITGFYVKDTDLHGHGARMIGTNNPTELYFYSRQLAEFRLLKVKKALLRDSYERDGWFYIKPNPSRFEIIEGEVKVLPDITEDCLYRIKDKQSGLYYWKQKKFHEVGRIYKSLQGCEPVVTKLTDTPKQNRDTNAKKVLYGKPECFNIEVEPCILEF